MTTSLQTDPRRASRDAVRKPPRRPLEMPVLFQLADLSLPRAKAAPSSAPQAAVVEPVTTLAAPEINIPIVAPPTVAIAEPIATPEPLKTESPKSPKREISQPETLPLESPKAVIAQVEPQPLPVASPMVAEESKSGSSIVGEQKSETPAIAESTSTTTVAESTPSIAVAVTSSATDATPPKEPTAPSPRERAEQRAKNRQPVPASNDWMRTHGKFIAVGFVIALIVTIYMAQNGDEPAPANPDAAASAKTEAKAPPAENEAESKITDAHTAKESVVTAGHEHSPGLLKETSPAEEHSPAQARAELHAPQTSDSAKDPSGESDVAESKSLFPWKEPVEARVASKPDNGRSNIQLNPHVTEPKTKAKDEAPAEELPAEEPPAEEAPSLYGPPSSQRQVPAATQPSSLGQRVGTPAGYSVTSENSFREYEPPLNRAAPAQPRASSQASPASYQPGIPNNVPPTRTSGPRNERTGSGLY